MIVSWLTTNRCNLRCSHCYQDAGAAAGDELNTAEARALIDSIAAAGFRVMIFSGGEPLLREDLDELVAYAAARGLRPVFGTNGTLLTRERARALRAAGAAAMGISVDSLDEGAHNRFRGHPDAYAMTMRGIRACREEGLPFQLHTTVMDWNRGELAAITDFAVAQGAVAHYPFFLVPVGRGRFLERDALALAAYEETLRELMGRQAALPIEIKPTCAPQFLRIAAELGVDTRFTRGCLAGLSYCIVDPQGLVRPCAYMTEAAGSVRERPFADIWRSSELFARLRTRVYGGACGACEHADACGGCRARAGYYAEGDCMAEDPYCLYAQSLRGAGA